MVSVEEVRRLALSFSGVVEKPHFDKPSFRFRDRIFATLWVPQKRAVLKLTATDQSVFSSFDSSIFFPVPGAWGRKGWTMVELSKVRKDMFRDALSLAYEGVARVKRQ